MRAAVVRASLVALAVGLALWGVAVPAGALPNRPKAEPPSAARRDPAALVDLVPTDDELPRLLKIYEDLIRPGEPFAFPVDIIDDIVLSRRFVRGAMFGYETVDGTLLLNVVVIDLGDPRVLQNVDVGEWFDLAGPGFPQGAVTRPDAVPDDGFAEYDVAWHKGPLLFVVIVDNLAQSRTRDQLRHLMAEFATTLDAGTPRLPEVDPVRPATPFEEAVSLGVGIATQALSILFLRWIYTWLRDPTARRRLRGWGDRDLGRPPPPARSHVTDISRPATAYLWATRVLGVVQVAAFVGFLSVSAATYVLADAGADVVVGRLVAALVTVTVLWLFSPKVAGTLCRLLSGGSFRATRPTGGLRRSRWLTAPGASLAALAGLLLSVSLAAGGLALVVRAVAVERTGARGAVSTGEIDQMNEGYVILALVALGSSAVPYVLARRVAQRSNRVARGADRRPGILFLRSFADDRLQMRAHRTARQHPLMRLRAGSRDRFEEILTWTLWRHGPVTAFSQPGSRLQPLGATREHYADETWESAVSHLIRRSALVVVAVDETDALRTEVRMIRSHGALERTLFVIPPVGRKERRKRLCWLENLLGTGRILSSLDRSTEVLVAQVSTDGEVHATVARFRDDLAYEVAIDTTAASAYHPQPEVTDAGPRPLTRPTSRGNRPKEALSIFGWTGVLALMAVSAATTRIFPDREFPEADPPDEVFQLSGPLWQVSADDNRLMVVPATRREVLVSPASGDQGWEHELDTDRIRDVAVGPTVVAMSTLESPLLRLLDAEDGHELASADLGEAAGALAVTDRFVVATRPQAGDIVVLDLTGSRVATVPAPGVPASVDADGRRAVVTGARSSTAVVVEFADMSSHAVEVGSDTWGVALDADTAYVTRPQADEVVEIDLAATEVTARVRVPDLATTLSPFVPAIAVSDRHVTVPLFQPLASAGIASIERDGLTERRWWLGLFGLPNELAIYDDVVYCGFTHADGFFGWDLDPIAPTKG